MNRREMIQRLGLVTAIGALFPMRAINAQSITPKPIDAVHPNDEGLNLGPIESEMLTRLRDDFPEFIIWATPRTYNPVSFVPHRGFLCEKRGTNQKTFKLKAAFPSVELIQDATAIYGLDVMEEVYRATRQQITFELLLKYSLPKNLSNRARAAILDQMLFTHPADYYSYPFRIFA
jgi:hypothetical protein